MVPAEYSFDAKMHLDGPNLKHFPGVVVLMDTPWTPLGPQTPGGPRPIRHFPSLQPWPSVLCHTCKDP